MSSDVIGGAILAFSLWIIFALALVGSRPIPPAGEIWVVTRSDKIKISPDLVRAAHPATLAESTVKTGPDPVRAADPVSLATTDD
jgi:hypothetical protein